MFFSYPP